MSAPTSTSPEGRCSACGFVATHDAAQCPRDLVAAVKAHALAHYDDGGWDVIVECWGDQQIADALTSAVDPIRTAEQAIAHFANGVVAIWADQQADKAHANAAPSPSSAE